MAQDERERLKQAGFTDAEINEYLATKSPAATTTAPTQASQPAEVPTQRLRSLAQGATFGFADELEAAARSILPGETYEQAIQDVRGKMAAYQQDRPMEALGYEVAGGLATGLAGGGRALAASAGRAGLRSALKAGASRAATSAIGQGALSGAGAAEGSLENRLKGAAVGGAFGAAVPFGFAQLGRLPVAKQIGQGISKGYDVARRGATNLAEETPLQSLGRMFEPTDATRISRQAAEALPGGVEGPTIASMPTGTEAARAAESQALIAAQQGKLSARQATAARRMAEEEARLTREQIVKEESTLRSLAKQKAGAVEEIGATRFGKLTGAAKAAETEAKALGSAAKTEIRQVEQAAREQAKIATQNVIEEARASAGETIGQLRGKQPRGSAAQLQESIRNKQTADAIGHYDIIRGFGAPPDADPEIYKEIFSNPSLRSAYESAIGKIQKELRNAKPSEPIRLPPRNLVVDGNPVTELTLEGMDKMRREILSPQYRKGPDVVGLSRSQKKEAIDTINRLEERYLAGFGTSDAAEALKAARGAYRQQFLLLEAVQDGLNLGVAKVGKKGGLLVPNRMQLDEVIKRVGTMTPDQKEAFQVGAREWFDRVIQEEKGSALKIAKDFSSEAAQRRLALAYGDDAVETLRQFAPEVIEQRAKSAAAKVRAEGQQLVADITGRTQAAIAPKLSYAERAAGLATRAEKQATARAQQIVGQRQATTAQRMADIGRTTGAQVKTAREAERAAQEEAGRLASELTAARVAKSQTQQTSFKDLAGALGGSTQQQTFLQRLLPQMSPEQRASAVEVLGSNLQRELQDLSRSGKSPEVILQRVRELQQNDVVRELFGPQMEAFVQQLSPTVGSRLPQLFRPSISGVLGRRIGGNFNE